MPALHFLGGYDQVIQQQVQMKAEVIKKKEKKREKKIDEVVIKTKKKKILCQLEETHRQKFYKDINVTELKEFDEISVRNFNKEKK